MLRNPSFFGARTPDQPSSRSQGGSAMEHGSARIAVRALALGAVLVLLPAAPAVARTSPGPTVDVHSAAGLAPDGRSMFVEVFASCPERWAVVSATVTV